MRYCSFLLWLIAITLLQLGISNLPLSANNAFANSSNSHVLAANIPNKGTATFERAKQPFSSTQKVTNRKKNSKKLQKTSSRKTHLKKLHKRKKYITRAPGDNFKGAILYNVFLDKVTFERRADTLVPPASLTKILSIYTALDIMKSKKISPNTKVKVSAKAAKKGGSRMGLHAGDIVTLNQLFYGMAISSGNDAAVALAEYFGKTETSFVLMMNRKAKKLGMKRSTFKNASGLPAKGQYTTPRDMLALAKSYLSEYPENLTKYHSYKTLSYKGRTSSSANPLLGRFKGADGLKTGFVNASGYNVIATSNRDGVRLIAVLLGAPTSKTRSYEITSLMEAGYGGKGSIVSDLTLKKKHSK